jgi:hypothetical protein
MKYEMTGRSRNEGTGRVGIEPQQHKFIWVGKHNNNITRLFQTSILNITDNDNNRKYQYRYELRKYITRVPSQPVKKAKKKLILL